MNKTPLTVVLPTLNSAGCIARAIDSAAFAAEVIILDGNSTDATRVIAAARGARVERQSDDPTPNLKCTDFSAMKNRGIALAANDWVLMLDSDEYLTEPLAREIAEIVANPANERLIYEIPRHYTYRGREIEVALGYPFWAPWLFNKKISPRYERKIHERLRWDAAKYPPGRTRHFILAPVDILTAREQEKKWRRYVRMDAQMLAARPRGEFLRFAVARNLANIVKKSLKLCLIVGATVLLGKRSLPMWLEIMRIRYYWWLICRAVGARLHDGGRGA